MATNKVSFGDHSDDAHKCYGEQEGDWIVFRCPLCDDYERRINIKNAHMESRVSRNNNIPHYAFYMKPGFDNFDSSEN